MKLSLISLIAIFFLFLILKRKRIRGWSTKLAGWAFHLRYVIMFLVVILVVVFGIFLHEWKNWNGKDTIQVCTGLFIFLTLFFAALNYEFSSSKARKDYEAARHLLTFNTACEWHKSPIKDYQKVSISFENKFIDNNKTVRTVEDFEKFIDDPQNLDFRESLKGILNYFESSSIAAHKCLIEKDFIKEFFFSIYKTYYRDYIFYIDRQRVIKNNEKMWSNFTSLVEEWHPMISDDIKTGKIKSIIIT